MAQILPLVILAIVFIGVVSYSRRSRQRAAAADSERRQHLSPGSEVMTTSGLYGTVVAVNDDDSVLLSIAPGVEVKWTIAALREVRELPAQYQAPISGAESSDGTKPDPG
ncbi:MAG: preprotein translocase subunit YajC [Jatrophihabitans sp.]